MSDIEIIGRAKVDYKKEEAKEILVSLAFNLKIKHLELLSDLEKKEIPLTHEELKKEYFNLKYDEFVGISNDMFTLVCLLFEPSVLGKEFEALNDLYPLAEAIIRNNKLRRATELIKEFLTDENY